MATFREQYIEILKITLVELADALCRLAYDERPEPFRINKDQSRLPPRVAELWIHGAELWIKELQAVSFRLPISGTPSEWRGAG